MKIIKIEKEKYKGNVYNFHCSPDENYFADNILVHNCYKKNTQNGQNMSFETFKKVLDKFDKHFLTQIAFGLDSQATSNPDLWEMMKYSREQGVVPNITVANISDETADKLVSLCGAVAVSRYENKDICYDSVQKLVSRGMKQVNIHICIHENSFVQTMETLQDRLTDPRLSKLNAIVMLSLKQKGRGVNFTPLSLDKFKVLCDYALDNKIGIGFDSCGANKFMKVIEDRPEKEKLMQYIEPCESSCFSSYISVDAKFYPCSFAEKTGGWEEGLDVLNCTDFIKDIWSHPKTLAFREKLLTCNRNCPLFKV